MENVSVGICLYTDGGCRPSRGFGGWGVHGYTYTIDPTKKTATATKGGLTTAVGYVDDLYPPPAVYPIDYVDKWGSLDFDATNNLAEIFALLVGLNTVIDSGAVEAFIQSDSEYAIKGYNDRLDIWARDNWIKSSDSKPIANMEVWKELYLMKLKLAELGINVTIQWVPAHCNVWGNEAADRLATRGVMLAKKQAYQTRQLITPAKEYWDKLKPKVSRMLPMNNWYFLTNVHESSYKTEDGMWKWFMGTQSPEDSPGKRLPDAAFCVSLTVEEQPLLSKIRELQNAYDNTNNSNLIIGKVDNIHTVDTVRDLSDDVVTLPTYARDMYLSDETTNITTEVSPLKVGGHAIRVFDSIFNLLNQIRTGQAQPQTVVTDITPVLVSKNKLTDLLKQTTKCFSVEVQYDVGHGLQSAGIPIKVGLDCPDRNTLAWVASKSDVKISIVTWPESEHGIRFATLVSAGTDILLWSSVNANLFILVGKKK